MLRCTGAVLLMISRLYSSLCALRFVELGWVECGKGSNICIGIITLPHRINVGPVRSFVRSVSAFIHGGHTPRAGPPTPIDKQTYSTTSFAIY